MLETIKNKWQVQILLLLYLILTVWWLYLNFVMGISNVSGQLFAAVYGVVALWGGLWGLQGSVKWGGYKSIMGRSILFFSLGLLFQEFGQLSYSFYIYFLHNDVPYPSIGDIGYFGSIPLYIYATYLLAKASGVKIGLSSFQSKIQAVVIPILMLAVGYLLFLDGYEFDFSVPLTIFLDFGYPLLQAIYVSLAILTYLLSRNVLGGLMKHKVLFILVALVVQFLADYTFLFQATRGSWYAGGVNDYIYLTAYVLMSLSLFYLSTTADSLRR